MPIITVLLLIQKTINIITKGVDSKPGVRFKQEVGTGNFTNWQNIAPWAPYMFEVHDYNDDGLEDIIIFSNGKYVPTSLS